MDSQHPLLDTQAATRDFARQLGVDLNRIPRHIAIIMDGNGRWAKARGLDRSMGHQQGVETVREITTTASRLGVRFLHRKLEQTRRRGGSPHVAYPHGHGRGTVHAK